MKDCQGNQLPIRREPGGKLARLQELIDARWGQLLPGPMGAV